MEQIEWLEMVDHMKWKTVLTVFANLILGTYSYELGNVNVLCRGKRKANSTVAFMLMAVQWSWQQRIWIYDVSAWLKVHWLAITLQHLLNVGQVLLVLPKELWPARVWYQDVRNGSFGPCRWDILQMPSGPVRVFLGSSKAKPQTFKNVCFGTCCWPG